MDIETIKVLSRPAVWLVIFIVFMFLFKKQIGMQILKLKRICCSKEKGLAAEFDELKELGKDIPQIKDRSTLEKEAKLEFVDLYSLVESSPKLAIAHAWGFIEVEAFIVLSRAGFFKKEPPDKIIRNKYLLIQALKKATIIDDKLGNYLEHFYAMSKIALEHSYLRISEKNAIKYLDQTEIIYDYLKKIEQ